MPTRESKIESDLKKWTDQLGITNYKFVSPSHRGVPDRILIRNGKVLFLELKAPGKKPTELQRYEMARLFRQKMNVAWVDSLEGAKEVIRKFFERI